MSEPDRRDRQMPEAKTGPGAGGEAGADPAGSPPFPVVGIGASAGGLEALKELLEKMPAETGMAFVVVTHQHPGHVSLLPELLARETAIPVTEAGHGTRLEPDHVYIGPPGGDLTILDGILLNPDHEARKSPPLLVDGFFRSLAKDRRERAIGIILSGTGTDGTLGLKEIKAEGGMIMVQTPGSAKYSGMPASALATGLADYVLEPVSMPESLVAYTRGPYLDRKHDRGHTGAIPEQVYREVLAALHRSTGHDFSHYKPSTTTRRIARRMNVHQIVEPAQYLRFVHENPHELDLLFKELLINVTNFFRDPEAWDALARGPLPDLLASFPEDHVVRAWAPGCTSGEESYTIAIVLRECMEKCGRQFNAQIFGTDLDPESIDAARAGVYPVGIAADISPERLDRWFAHKDEAYQVRSEIREMAVFAQQNVIADPPFTKLDLLSCRNLLIYLNAELQKYLLPVFHYALRPGGLLFLGSAETIGHFGDLFEPVDKKWKIFRARDVPTRLAELSSGRIPVLGGDNPERARSGEAKEKGAVPFARHLDRLMLARFCPPSAVVNESGDIVHIYGRTGLYLEPASGEAHMNLLDMAREGLAHTLSAALRRAQTQKEIVTRRGIKVKTNGEHQLVDLTVVPFTEPEPLRGLFLVTFEASPPMPAGKKRSGRQKVPDEKGDGRIAELEREIQDGYESHQSTTEELETANEELKSANEELQSTNEELQSTNEELETSKEELHSLNEELNTVNSELQGKVDELSQAYGDMQNLLENTNIATLFLDTDLKILRFTEHARKLIRLVPSDVGRDIGDLVSTFDYGNLETDCREVLRTLQPKEVEVRADDESVFTMRIGPYRTTGNLISGVVVTFARTGEMRAFFESIVHTVRHPLIVLDGELRVISANRAFLNAFHLRSGAVAGKQIYEIGSDRWDNDALRRLLEDILPRDTSFEDFDLEIIDPRTGAKRLFMLNARRLRRAEGKAGMILLACEDVTEKFDLGEKQSSPK